MPTGWEAFGQALGGGAKPQGDVYMETLSKRARLDAQLMDAKKKRDERLARENLRDALRIKMPGASEDDIRATETLMIGQMTGEYKDVAATQGIEQRNRARQKAIDEYALGHDLAAARSLAVAADKPLTPYRSTASGTYNQITGESQINDVGRAEIARKAAQAFAQTEEGNLRARTPQLGGGKKKASTAAETATDYPPAPRDVTQRVQGQVYTAPDGRLVQWTGAAWKVK